MKDTTIDSIMSKLTQETQAIDRSEIKHISFVLCTLSNFTPDHEQVAVKSTLFYQAVNAIAADPSTDSTLTEFEINVLRGILETSPKWLETLKTKSTKFSLSLFNPFDSKHISFNVVSRLVALFKAQAIFSAPAPASTSTLKIDEVIIPDENTNERKEWFEKTIAEFQKEALVYNHENKGHSKILADGLHHLYFEREKVKQFFDEKGAWLYQHGTCLVHLENANQIARSYNRDVEWNDINTMIDNFLCVTLRFFAIAVEWQKIEGTPEKLKDFFKLVGTDSRGPCFEARTRQLFDDTPMWVYETECAVVTNDTLASPKETVIATAWEHISYFNENMMPLAPKDVVELTWNCLKSKKQVLDDGEIELISREYIQSNVDTYDFTSMVDVRSGPQ